MNDKKEPLRDIAKRQKKLKEEEKKKQDIGKLKPVNVVVPATIKP